MDINDHDINDIYDVNDEAFDDKKPRQKKHLPFILGTIIGIFLVTIFAFSMGSIQHMLPYSSSNQGTKLALSDRIFEQKKALINGLINDQFIFDYKKNDMQDGMLKGMVNSLNDPYSQYYTPEEYNSFKEMLSGSFSGIGVSISNYKNTPYLEITNVFKNSPAMKAGIKKGDIIEKVGNEIIKSNETIDQVITKIKGKKGTSVILGIRRNGAKNLLEFKITRDDIEKQFVYGKMLENHIGYIHIIEFSNSAQKEFDREYDKLKKKGMKKLIIDLRNNPGGLFDIAVGILDDFLPDGLIVYTKDKKGNEEKYEADSKVKYDIPTDVLVNGNSASSSEIFAGVLKDRKKATIVGERTFGKGIVQNTFELGDGSALKLTISKYYTPNGYIINKHGIEPDIKVTYKVPPKKKKYTYKDDNQVLRTIKDLNTKN